MSAKMILKLRELLLKRKREIFKLVAHLEMGRNAQEERIIEMGDAAQKEDLIRLLDHLVERGKEEIKEINRALERMAAGNYGNCEICGKRIELKRLKVIPATRMCRSCAQEYEKAQDLRQHPRDEIMADELLDEYRYLLDEGGSRGRTKFPNDVNLTSLKEV